MTTHSRFRFPIVLLLAILAVLLWNFAGAKDYGRAPLKDNGKRIGKQSPVRRPHVPSTLDQIFASTDTISIPDGPHGSVVDSIIVDEDITISDLDVKVDITHTWVRDLTLILSHVPAGGSPDSVLLLDLYPYGFAQNMTQTWFADEAGYWVLEAPVPMTGTFRPMESLALFNGRSAAGIWYLEIRDRFAFDTGTVNEWALEFNHQNTIEGFVVKVRDAESMPISRAHISIVDTLEMIVDTVEIVIDTTGTDTSYITDTTYVIDLFDDTYTRTDGSFAFPRLSSDTVDFTVEHPFAETKRLNHYIISNNPAPSWQMDSEYLFLTAHIIDNAIIDIPDGGASGVPITLEEISDTVSIEIVDVELALDIVHPYIGDIKINLESGGGQKLTDVLNIYSYEDGNNLLDCRLDDDALLTIEDGIPPYTGVWKPTNPLSYFNDSLSSGNWTLTVFDKALEDSGYVTRTDLTLVYREVGVVEGRVTYDSRDPKPVVGCQVSVPGTDINDCTDQDGEYYLPGVQPGTQIVEFNHKIYSTDEEQTIEVSSGQTAQLNVLLTSDYGSPVRIDSLPEYTIPDAGDSITVDTLEIEVGDIGFIADVNVLLTIEHSFMGDLTLTLIGPDSTTSASLTLPSNEHGGANFTNTIFDDQSCGRKWYESEDTTAFTGVWQPEEPLSSFDGTSASGTWFLVVADNYNLDLGVLNSWSLIFYIDTTITEAPILDTDDDFTFHGNYPNPFNPSTTFSFDLIRDAQVKLILYNVLGQQVQTLLDKPLTTGIHQVGFDANTLPSGIYFARLSTPHQSNTKKIILLK